MKKYLTPLRIVSATVAVLLVAITAGGAWFVPSAFAEAGGPTVTLTSTSATTTSTSPIPVTATFSEGVNGFTASDVTVTNGTVSNFVSASSTVYTFDVSPSANGTVTVMVNADQSTASATPNKMNQASNTLTFTFTSATSAPVISNVNASVTGTSTATITWNTDSAATAKVFYGTTLAYGSSSTLDPTASTTHSVTLSGLTEATLYHYQVQSGNGAATTTSSDNTFVTFSTASSTPLAVTSVDTVSGTATADDTFAHGFKWVMHLTVPDVENAFRMKFSDFVGAASSTIAANNNIRIFTPQSSNSTDESTATMVGNAYGPWIYLNGDTSTTTPGRQIDVTIEARVPTGTNAGSYTTTYGAQSVPQTATSTTP